MPNRCFNLVCPKSNSWFSYPIYNFHHLLHFSKCKIHSSTCSSQNAWSHPWLLSFPHTAQPIYQHILPAVHSKCAHYSPPSWSPSIQATILSCLRASNHPFSLFSNSSQTHHTENISLTPSLLCSTIPISPISLGVTEALLPPLLSTIMSMMLYSTHSALGIQVFLEQVTLLLQGHCLLLPPHASFPQWGLSCPLFKKSIPFSSQPLSYLIRNLTYFIFLHSTHHYLTNYIFTWFVDCPIPLNPTKI